MQQPADGWWMGCSPFICRMPLRAEQNAHSTSEIISHRTMVLCKSWQRAHKTPAGTQTTQSLARTDTTDRPPLCTSRVTTLTVTGGAPRSSCECQPPCTRTQRPRKTRRHATTTHCPWSQYTPASDAHAPAWRQTSLHVESCMVRDAGRAALHRAARRAPRGLSGAPPPVSGKRPLYAG